LLRLSWFLEGYLFCLQENENENTAQYLHAFQRFIEDKYDNHSGIRWNDSILQVSKTDEKAFDQFYQDLEEFVKRGCAYSEYDYPAYFTNELEKD
jgi:hypothetical protein